MLKFHEWTPATHIPTLRTAKEVQQAINDHIINLKTDYGICPENDENEYIFRMTHFTTEAVWKLDRRPYYSIYPKIADALLRTKLDRKVTDLHFPTAHDSLLLRFARGHELLGTIRTVLICNATKDTGSNRHVMSIIGSRLDGNLSISTTVVQPDVTLEEAARVQEFDWTATDKHVTEAEVSNEQEAVLRVALGVSLLEHDPELIVPDVLDRDRARLKEAFDPQIVQRLQERAQQRGKVGWIIGECTDDQETSERTAHYRRAHMGFRWSGPGRSRLKYTKIKGCIVHRDKLTKVPTGYLDDEQEQTNATTR